MTSARRPPAIRHCTSEPLRFFGRRAELALLDAALDGHEPSVVALVGPGGQGKTAIVQHWLHGLAGRPDAIDGMFLWSFYRGKDSDLCLREILAYAEGLDQPPEVSASFCVEKLLPILRRERWALVLDGTEVVQHEQGEWFGRFVHPELGRLVDELASAPLPGVVVLTSRFPLPTLQQRRHARLLSLATLDLASAEELLVSLGVRGERAELAEAAQACGLHAKAVELLGTYLAHFAEGAAAAQRLLPALHEEGASSEELQVARVLAAFHAALPAEAKDILALATSFRQPATEARLLEYLMSAPLRHLLHDTWKRGYAPLAERGRAWLAQQVQMLVELRLLERVGLSLEGRGEAVIDAHPLVRRGFEDVLGAGHSARARAGFLRGRPDRRPPATLEESREEVELFHAYADAGLWNEADGTFVALDNPKHRFLAPAFERDLLLRFFPGGNSRQPPTWSGFGRQRSLAICFELLGEYEAALATYRGDDAPLRGDALIALGRLQPILDVPQAAQPWQTLWQAYRAHAFCLAGRRDEALRAAQACVAIDVYEWVHLFECLLRLGRLDAVDLRSMLYRPPLSQEHRWSTLARQRMRADYLRLRQDAAALGLGDDYRMLIEAYDRGGLPFERVLTRLSYARWLLTQQQEAESRAVVAAALPVCQRHGLTILAIDAMEIQAEVGDIDVSGVERARRSAGFLGPARP